MKLQADIEIQRPAAEVFEYLSNFENNPIWQGGMQSASFTTEPPIGVGSEYRQVAKFLGRDIVSTFRITAYEPGTSVSIETIESTFPIAVTRSVEPLGPKACRVRADIAGEPAKGLMKLAAPAMMWFGQRSVTGDYAKLKQILEQTEA